MIISVLLVVAGFFCLVFGANWLVEGATGLAKKYNVSDLTIGLTIVAFGTSAPELVVSVIASANGYSDIVTGNILGSNNFNLFIILGLSGIIFPITVKSSTAWKGIPISLLAAASLFLLLNDFIFAGRKILSRVDGILLLIMFLLFLYYVFTQMRKKQDASTEVKQNTATKIWILIFAGFSGLVLGGQFVVSNSVSIANHLGVSDKIIGLTIIAAGTSLPELVTSVVAAFKKNSDIAIGNVIGSNIFNILLILSLSALIKPIEYNPKFNLDLYILIGGTMFLLVSMLTGKRKCLDRWEATILFCCYSFYTVYLVMNEMA